MKANNGVAGLFLRACQSEGLTLEPEYRFAPPRRWRFDFALVAAKVALEVQGGLFVQGRHARGAALLTEHEKLNRAAILGWRVLYVTPSALLRMGPDLLKQASQ